MLMDGSSLNAKVHILTFFLKDGSCHFWQFLSHWVICFLKVGVDILWWTVRLSFNQKFDRNNSPEMYMSVKRETTHPPALPQKLCWKLSEKPARLNYSVYLMPCGVNVISFWSFCWSVCFLASTLQTLLVAKHISCFPLIDFLHLQGTRQQLIREITRCPDCSDGTRSQSTEHD